MLLIRLGFLEKPKRPTRMQEQKELVSVVRVLPRFCDGVVRSYCNAFEVRILNTL